MTKSKRSRARTPSSSRTGVIRTDDLVRIQQAVAARHDGPLPKGSYVGRVQRGSQARWLTEGRSTPFDITSHQEQFMSRQSDNDNHSNQLNPNNDEYWHSRGEDERPDDWEDQIAQTGDED